MTTQISIEAAQELWKQHENIEERLGSLSSRLNTLSCQLQKEFDSEGHVFNGGWEAIDFLNIIEESCKEMKSLIEKKDEVRDEIDKVEGEKSLWSPPERTEEANHDRI